MKAALLGRRSPKAPILSPPFRVVGNVLRDETGRRVGLVALEVRMVPFYDNGSGGQDSYLASVTSRNYAQRDAEFAKLRSLGCNAVRCQIMKPAVYNAALYESKAAAVARCKAIVDSARAAGLVAILAPDAIGNNLSNWTGYKPMMADLVAAIGNDPNCIWELWNEPADYSGSPAGATYYRPAIKGMGAYLRTLGVTQPIIVPWNNYQQGLDGPKAKADMDNIAADVVSNGWAGQGVLYAYHMYNDHQVDPARGNHGDVFGNDLQAEIYSKLGGLVADYPIIMTEAGRFNGGITSTGATTAEIAYVAGLTRQGLNGISLFSFDWALNSGAFDNSSMTYDGLNLIAWGTAFIAAAFPNIYFTDGLPVLPKNSAAPAITGTATTGQTLTCSTGTWAGSPTYAYQWMRAGADISGATASTYTCQVADQGKPVTCRVTATNGAGATKAITAAVTPGSGGSIAKVGAATLLSSAGNGSAKTFTLTRTIAAGNMVTLALNLYSGSTPAIAYTVTDSAGGTWTKRTSSSPFGGADELAIWDCIAHPGGTNVVVTVTVTSSLAPQSSGVSAELNEWSGVGSVDVVGTPTSGSSGTASAPAIVPTVNGDLILAFADTSNVPSASPTSPWTALTGAGWFGSNQSPSAYQIAAGITSQTATWTMSSGSWAGLAVAYKT